MVTTLTLPSSALGFALDSNNQYIISVTLVMKEIIKMVAGLNSSISLYLRHHNIKYKYTFYINGTAWKSSNGYTDLTNTNVSFSNENISGYLSSSSLKQTLSCTVEISHPQFFCRLQSENYTFVTINKKSQQLKALNSSTGQYETIGLSFSNLSSSEKSRIDSIRWPLFNTENSSQQFVIPIGSASYTRRNGSIRAERFGGSAGQYFNLANPSSNKDYRANNGTEYRYVDSFTPAFRYYTEYFYLGAHDYTTTSSSEWATPSAPPPTLPTGENEIGRYTSYSFGGWWRNYNFKIGYFTDAKITPSESASYWVISNYYSPNIDNVDKSAFGIYVNRYYSIYSLGDRFTVSYTYAETYEKSTTWPAAESFITGGSAIIGASSRYGSNWVFDRWVYLGGRKDYYYCVGRYYNERDREETYSLERHNGHPYFYAPPDSNTQIREYMYTYSGVIMRYRHYTDYDYVSYAPYIYEYIRYYGYYMEKDGFSFYEKWLLEYKRPLISYDFYSYTTYTTKSSTITGKLEGAEHEYIRWWDYETRTNWYIDSNNNIRYYNNYQVIITNDTNSYRTS